MDLTKMTDDELLWGFVEHLDEDNDRLLFKFDYLIELDRRKLFFQYSSLRAYLVGEHRIEDWVAERWIRASRMVKRFPELREMFRFGKMNITNLELVMGVAHREKLDETAIGEVIEAVSGKSKRGAMQEIAYLYPRSVNIPKDRVIPLDEVNSDVRFVAQEELLDMVTEVRGILAYSHPNATLAEIFKVVLTDYLKRHHPEEKAKRAQVREEKRQATEPVGSPTPARAPKDSEDPVQTPDPEQKRVPSAKLTHALTLRDGYQCGYVDPKTQKRCQSKFALQIDHVEAWALDGKTELSNLRYLCPNHHRRISFLQFGDPTKFFRPKRE